MRHLKPLLLTVLATALVAAPFSALAVEKKAEKADKVEKTDKVAKKYQLKVCLVSDEKFGGDMGEPYVFVHDGQEVKLCCKSCKKDFDKEKKKFMKKLQDEEKKLDASKTK